jgi:hypothetical protein
MEHLHAVVRENSLNVRSVEGVVVTVIVWWLDLQLPMQSVPITTDVVSSNPDQDEVNNILL